MLDCVLSNEVSPSAFSFPVLSLERFSRWLCESFESLNSGLNRCRELFWIQETGDLYFLFFFFLLLFFFYSKFVKIAVTSFVFKMPEKVKIPICAFYHMFVNICIYIYMYVKSLYYVFTSVSSTTIRVWDVVLYFYRFNHDIVFNISKMLGYVRNTNRYLKKINTKISSGNRVYKNCSKEELQ